MRFDNPVAGMAANFAGPIGIRAERGEILLALVPRGGTLDVVRAG